MDIEVKREGNLWVFSTGETLPVVSGGSDTGPLQLGSPTGEPATTEPQENPDSLAGDFLKNIPDTDKAIVEKYIKDWDAGVTKKFQSIHEQYKPYKELGELSDIQASIQLRELLDNDPEYVYSMLAQEFGNGNQGQGNQGGQQQQGNDTLPPMFQGVNPELAKYIQDQNGMLEQLAQLVLDGRNQNTARQEDEALDAELKRLKDTHGDFDEDYVLAKMWHGASGDDAVKAYQNLSQSILNGREKPKPQPPGLFGGGVIPTDTPDVGKLSGKETKNLVAELLARAHES